MKQSNIFVLGECEINADKKSYSEPHVDLHKLRMSPRSPAVEYLPI